MKPIRKAVFPVAGLGTHFLPATKAMPKEMLPIIDKPVFGLRYEGTRYDCGSKAGFFQATIAYGRKYHGFDL